MKSTWLRAFALLFAFTLIAAACGDDEEEQPVASGEAEEEATDGEAEEMAEADIVDTAVASGEFPTLVAALQAADLVDTLKGEGPFTVFAPTEEAFADALEALGVTAEELLANPDLASILTYHVVPGNVPAADVVGLDGQEVETVNGATVTIGVDGETVTVNDATVVTTDIMASNGVIHVIDTVLLPPAG
jgi:transforming growth factor-beta-induced protein